MDAAPLKYKPAKLGAALDFIGLEFIGTPIAKQMGVSCSKTTTIWSINMDNLRITHFEFEDFPLKYDDLASYPCDSLPDDISIDIRVLDLKRSYKQFSEGQPGSDQLLARITSGFTRACKTET